MSSKQNVGRPGTEEDTRKLILRLYEESGSGYRLSLDVSDWSYTIDETHADF